MKRFLALSSLVVLGVASIAASQAAQVPAPPTIDPKNFIGTVTQHPTTDIRMLRYSFVPGARTNWHSHEGGQVIFIEQGRMRAFERGGAARNSVRARPISSTPASRTGTARCPPGR